MQPGRVEVIAGPMFAGKTEELLRRERRALIAGRRVQVFTRRLDTRRGTDRIASHAGLPFEPLPSLMALAERVDKLTAICTVCGADASHHTPR